MLQPASLQTYEHDWVLRVLARLVKRQHSMAANHSESSHAVVCDVFAERLALGSAGDWATIEAVCGYNVQDFAAASAGLPLNAAAIQHFLRNHRDCDASLAGRFEILAHEVPDALAVLYHIYHTQVRLDAEAALFLAQTSGTVRVARTMADLLAIGGFNHGDKSILCHGRAYAVAAAYDTAAVLDAVNDEARERLALPADHHDHLLQLTPDAISLLAAGFADTHRLPPLEFFHKANLLAEARQDVNRFPSTARFATALYEGDLPISEPWVQRLVQAMRSLLPQLVGTLPAPASATVITELSA